MIFIGTTGHLRAKRLSPDIDTNSGVWAAFAIRLGILGFYLSGNKALFVVWG